MNLCFTTYNVIYIYLRNGHINMNYVICSVYKHFLESMDTQNPLKILLFPTSLRDRTYWFDDDDDDDEIDGS